MKEDKQALCPAYAVEPVILTVRSQKVILDADLARIYGAATKVLNRAVKRNRERFPEDFIFQLTQEEAEQYGRSRSQIVTLNTERNWSQIVTGSDGGMRRQIGTASRRNVRHMPFAFTEHGAIMAATVLNSPRAVQMSVFVVRAFIKMREQLLNRTEMEKRLAEIEKGLLSHDAALRDLYARIRPLLLPPPEPPSKKSIGFQVKEHRARYGTRRDK